jgi:hypothetical protein
MYHVRLWSCLVVSHAITYVHVLNFALVFNSMVPIHRVGVLSANNTRDALPIIFLRATLLCVNTKG